MRRLLISFEPYEDECINSYILRLSNANLYNSNGGDILNNYEKSQISSVSAAIVGAYMSMVPPQYVLVAIILNALSCLIITTLLIPDKEAVKDEAIDVKDVVQTKSIFEAISQGALVEVK